MGGDSNLYGYTFNDPVNFTDPSGTIIPALLIAWGVIELGLTLYDIYDAWKTLGDPCASDADKAISGGGLLLGGLLPGGGYGAGAKRGLRWADEVADAAGGTRRHIWSSTKSRTSVENAFSHWQKHGAEFPELQNAKQYVEKATDFLHNPPEGALIKTRSNGDTLVYDPATNIFGVMSAEGSPRTMFRPRDGVGYWERQQ